MFRIITQYFAYLKHLPFLAHIFDALLRIHLFLFGRKLLEHLDDIEEAVSSWKNVSLVMHKYGGTQFNLNNQEIGHLHGNGLLDVLLSLSLKAELMREYPIQNHHIFKKSGWISFWIKTHEDKNIALHILQKAYFLRQRILTTR